MKLFQKTTLFLIAAQLLFLSTNVWIMRDTVRSESSRLVEVQQAFAERLLTVSLASGLGTSDRAIVDELLKEAVAEPFIDAVALTDSDGVASTAGSLSSSSSGRTSEEWRTVAVARKGMDLGTLQIAYSPSFTHGIQSRVNGTTANLAIAGLIIAVAAGFAIASTLASRINRVSEMAKQLAAGQFVPKNPVSGKDEIAELAAAVFSITRRVAFPGHPTAEDPLDGGTGPTFGSQPKEFVEPPGPSPNRRHSGSNFYTEFLEALPAVMFRNIVTRDGKVLSRTCLSPNVSEKLGYTVEQINDIDFYDSIMMEDGVSQRTDVMADAIENGKPVSAEYRIRHGDGTIKWQSAHGTLSPLGDGTYAYNGISLDITDRKNAEALLDQKSKELEDSLHALEEANLALNESREYYKDIIDNTPGVVFRNWISKDLKTIKRDYLSPSAAELHGFPLEELLKPNSFNEILVDDDREKRDRMLRLGAETGQRLEFELRMRHGDGTVHTYRIVARMRRLYDGNYTYNGMSIDITAAKEAERVLREQSARLRDLNQEVEKSREYYKDIIDHTPGVVFRSWVGEDLKTVQREFLSSNAEGFYGYSRADLFTPHFLDNVMVAGETDRRKDILEQGAKTGKRMDFELQMRHGHDGTVHTYRVLATIKPLDKGGYTFNGLSLDVTEQKKSEQALAAQSEKLQQLNSELEESREYYKDILDNVPGIVFRNWVSKDLKTTRREFISPGISEILGMSVEDFMKTDSMAGMILDEDAEIREDAVRRAASTGEQVEYELRVNHVDKTIHTYRYLARLRPLPDGNHLYSGVALDVTREMKQTQELAAVNAELQESRAYYKDILDTVPGVVFRNWVSDDLKTLKRQFVSPIIEEMFGITIDSYMREESMDELVIPEDHAKRLDVVREGATSGKQMDYELRMRHADGTIHTFRFNSLMRPLPEGGYNFSGIAIDVTKAKEHEKMLEQQSQELEKLNVELETSREYYKDIVETLPGVVFRNILSADLKKMERVFLSANAEAVHGYPIHRLLDGEFYDSLVEGEIGENRRNAIKHAIDTGKRLDFEAQMRHADGEYRWFRAIANVKELPTGEYAYNGLYIDVSDRKKTEFALAEKQKDLEKTNSELEQSERRYNEIVNALPGVIFRSTVDRTGHIISRDYISDRAADLFGYSMEEIREPGFLDTIIHPEDLARRKEQASATSTTEMTAPIDLRYRHKDGSYRWITVTASVRENDDGTYVWHGVQIDATDKKKAEQEVELQAAELQRVNTELRESETRYREIVETIPGIVFRTTGTNEGDKLRREYMSPQGETFFGYATEKLMTPPFFTESVVHPDDIAHYRRSYGNSARSLAPLRFDYRYHRSDGETRWMMVSATIKRLDEDQLLWHGVQLDITEKKSAEHALEVINQGLENTVRERTADLRSANENLQNTLDELHQAQSALVEAEKMASLGQLVAGVAHEINTPIGISLTAITNLADFSKGTAEAFDSNALTKSGLTEHFTLVEQSNDIILANLQRASQLIRSFKQVAVDQTSDECRNVDLNEYTHEILRSLSPVLRPQRIAMYVDLPKGLRADLHTGHFAQIVTNLVNNAVTHAFVEGRDGQNELSILGSFESGYLELKVIDNGVGMAQEVKEHIFEPFFTTRRSSGGTGLGLHIVYNLVTQGMGGSIRCDSAQEGGTEFVIRIPLRVS